MINLIVNLNSKYYNNIA